MPGFGDGPSTSTDDLDQAAATLPVSQSTRLGEAFGHFGPTQSVINAFRGDFAGDLPGTPSESDVETNLPADTLNDRYGVPGYLRFNGPESDFDAAFQSHMAHERMFRDDVFARSDANPLTDIGASLTGALVDPTNVGLAFLTGGVGEGAAGVFGLGEAADAGAAITRVGRLSQALQNIPRTLAVGAIDNAPLVAANAGLSLYAGDDYGFGDALRDIAAGAVLHTAIHGGLEAAGALARPLNPEGLAPPRTAEEAAAQLAALRGEAPVGGAGSGPAGDFIAEAQRAGVSREDLMTSTSRLVPYTPEAIDALPPAARYGAWAKAVDDLANDRPVDVGQYVARELEPPDTARLDEGSAEPAIPSFRLGEDATAVTPRGTEIPVRYGLAELSDLVTSHTDDMQVNPAFPAELQPRARERAGSFARNLQLEQELNPKLLMGDVGAGAGAPIVSPDGVVESGNGRTIALRRAAAKGSPAYDRYKAELAAQGFDASGMRQPVLVRMRTDPLTGAQRSGLSHEMNADVTERMSAGEQAMADAQRMPEELFDHIEEGRGPTTSRAFARAFIDKVAPDQVGAMVDRDGRLSPEGARRIKAAVLAKAYGDPRLVGQIFEDETGADRKMAEGLTEAAPTWARLRGLVARGEVPRELDLTPSLSSAMDLVRYAAGDGRKLVDMIGQTEMFSDGGLSPFTEALLRLMYRDEGFTRPQTGDKIAFALKDYARQAAEVRPGPDLFGETPDESTARAILANVAEKFQRNDPGDLDARAPGQSRPDSTPREPPLIDLRPAGADGDGGRGGVSSEDQQGAARPAGARPAGDVAELERPGNEPGNAATVRATGRQFIAADADLRELEESTAKLAAENGLEPITPDNENPDTVAEAIRAAAVCLGEEGL